MSDESRERAEHIVNDAVARHRPDTEAPPGAVSEVSELSETAGAEVTPPPRDDPFLTVSESVSETAGRADQREHSASDTYDSSYTDAAEGGGRNLLAALRDGEWLDSQNFPPLRYAVEGLLPEGFSLTIGPPKAGKSWLALGMLLAVAGGTKAVGTIPMDGRRTVLYLALEDGDRRMQGRCRKLLGEEPIPSRFYYLTQVQPGAVVETIRQFLHRHPETALVIVDTLGKVMPPALPGESAYQRDYRVAGALKRISDEYPGLAVNALHHDRKAISDDFVDSVSGTHGLAGAADTIVVLARKRQATDALLKVTGRDVPEAEYAVRLEGGTWVLDGASLGEAAEAAQQREESSEMGDVSLDVLAFVRQYPDGIEAKEVVERFGKHAYQYLRRLADGGRIFKFKRGWYAPTPELPDSPEGFGES